MNVPWQVLEGHVNDRLADLPERSFHTVITSPPYWALRSYLPKGHALKPLEMGQEKSPDCFAWARGVPRCRECYVCRMTDVFAAVRRVLRDDGTLWLNVAGSYTSGGRSNYGIVRPGDKQATHSAIKTAQRAPQPKGWKPKDFVNVPALLAESLRADGWYLRAEVCLTKVAPMPESCRDRPTRATEKLYLFAKQGAYFYDQEAERQALATAPHAPGNQKWPDGDRRDGYRLQETRGDTNGRNLWDWWDSTDDDLPPAVWQWRPEPSKVKRHYATFPLWLPLRCIRLGTSAHGCCSACGAPWRRVVQRKGGPSTRAAREADAERNRQAGYNGTDEGHAYQYSTAIEGSRGARRETLGWSPSCKCPPAPPVPCRVLDPFAGTSTTGVAARLLGRHFTGIELSPGYARISRERLAACNPLDDAAWRTQQAPAEAPMGLFDGLDG